MEMSSSEDDMPLVQRRRSGRTAPAAASTKTYAVAEESSSGEDAPLTARKKSRLKREPAGGSEEEELSSDEDMPLTARRSQMKIGTAVQQEASKPAGVKEEEPMEEDESSDEDDIPLTARRLKKENVSAQDEPLKRTATRLKRKKVVKKDEDEDADYDLSPAQKKKRKTAAAAKKAKAQAAKSKAAKAKSAAAAKKKAAKPKKEGEPARATVKYDLPGQRKETPLDNDPARLFYESMYHEKLGLGKPSELAETWMLRHGLLDRETAKRVAKRLASAK